MGSKKVQSFLPTTCEHVFTSTVSLKLRQKNYTNPLLTGNWAKGVDQVTEWYYFRLSTCYITATQMLYCTRILESSI